MHAYLAICLTFRGEAAPNQSSEKTILLRKLVQSYSVPSMVKSQYGRAMDGSTACRDCSNMREMAMWEVTNPAPACQWSQSVRPPDVGGSSDG